MSSTEIKDVVRQKYARAARSVAAGSSGACCSGRSGCADPITSNLYDAGETGTLPENAVLASLAAAIPRRSPS